MMRSLLLILMTAATCFAQSEPPVNINFNLVQVNTYPSQEQMLAGLTTPGKRVVIDVGTGPAMLQYLAYSAQIPIKVRSASASGITGETDIFSIAWETNRVFVAPSGIDSFLVTSSRTGCPGTEVAPSVSVAFAAKGGWSDPPIRFGPITESTICPLGHGFTLEVQGNGATAPRVKLIESGAAMYGKR
ncbi:hypothetical protein IT157_00105 [bacterium]|nr:hypothetical protein [bacterium]